MVDVLNPEHTASKTLNTTLEANEVTTLEAQNEAPENNHHISAVAETQPAEPNSQTSAQAEPTSEAEISAAAPEPQAAAPQAVEAHDASSHEEEMDFGALLESFEHEQAAQEAAQAVDGNVVTGTVIKLTDKHVVVDVGLKSEGLIPIEQVLDHTGQPKLQAGQTIEVVVEHEEPSGGYLLSYDKALRHRVWDTIEKAANDKTPVSGLVVSRVKGGLTVDIGIKAFLPGSQVEIRPVRNLESYIGQTIDVRVIKLKKKSGNVVVSRKELLENEASLKRSLTLDHLEEGTVLTGTVKGLTEYGAFVGLGGMMDCCM